MATISGILTPEEQQLAARRAFALSLLKQGTESGPVGHPLGAVARALQGAIGGYQLGQLGREAEVKEQAIANLLMGAPGLGGGAPAATPAPTAAPSTISAPMVAPGGKVPSSPRVIGDDEGVRLGLYDAPTTPGARPPNQTDAMAAPAPFADRFGAANAAPPMARPVQTVPVAPPQPQRQPMTIPPEQQAYIKSLIANPATRQQGLALYSQYTKPAEPGKPTYGEIGRDLYNNPTFGWRDPNTLQTTPVSGGQPTFKEASNLREQVQNLPSYKNISQTTPIYKSMLKSANRDDRAADIDLIYGLAKIMDPPSVVREAELTMAEAIARIPDRLRQTIMSQLSEAGRLSSEVRGQLMAVAHSRMTAYGEMYEQDTEMYRGIANRYRINEADVIQNFGKFEPFKTAPKEVTVEQAREELTRRMRSQQK